MARDDIGILDDPLPTDGKRHRVATPLELLFDLCFVVAVAQASTKLRHAPGEAHVTTGAVDYLAVFFSIGWAWMNFPWFASASASASAYDVDDVPYRVATFVQIVGVLILAAGVPRAFDHDFAIVTLGYAVMRCGLVAQWLRAARGADPAGRRGALGYALGVSVCAVRRPLGARLPEVQPAELRLGLRPLLRFRDGGGARRGPRRGRRPRHSPGRVRACGARRVCVGGAVTVPVAGYLLALTLLHLRPHHAGPARTGLAPAAAVLVLATTALAAVNPAITVLATGLVLVLLIVAVEALGWTGKA